MFNKLQYISQGTTSQEQLNNIQLALDAGCKWIQLRFKNTTEEELIVLAEKVKKLCERYQSLFIINDHPNIAHAVNADGLHLGLTDMNITEAKKIIGSNKIVGGTANTLEHVLQRVEEGCSYIGLGPFRFTATKEKLSPILGLQGYEVIVNELHKRNISVPIYAIGGIVLEDITAIMRTGIYGVAVSGLITNHLDKKLVVQKFNTLLYEAVNDSQ
jgi:thiamine-phosphate pyrophosphorylase